jgi:beta-galactosidase
MKPQRQKLIIEKNFYSVKAKFRFRPFILLPLLFSLLLFNNLVLANNEESIYPVRKGEWAKSLNGVWKFKFIPSLIIGNDSLFFQKSFDVSRWDSIRVPGNWDMQGFGESTYQGIKEGTGLYRTEFKIPNEWRDRQTFILFDGALYATKVYINGNYVGSWSNGYSPFTYNISKYLKEDGENILAVEVASGSKGTDFDTHDAWSFYGIFRNVTLFSTAKTYLKDFTFTTTLDAKQNAHVSISSIIESPDKLKNIVVNGELTSDDKKTKKNFIIHFDKEKQKDISGKTTFIIDNPELWTAETPNLYTLTLKLINSGKELQLITERVGVREVSIKNSQLLLNGTAIKLRGIDIHQTSPALGNAFTEEYLLRDFDMLKKANINFVRTSHYPPHPRFTEMCDSAGFYVMEEVPFSGSGHLTDTSYQNILYSRAYSTLARDKNRPSIIVWSVGNENAVTDLTNNTAKYVKQLDSTRPVCFPEAGEYFHQNNQLIPEYVDILAPHYTIPSRLEEYAKKFTRPIIVTEYAHALGLDMDMMQNVWEVMYKNKNIAGGGVWDYVDQGILRKSKTPVDRNVLTPHVWLDMYNYYDAKITKGTDGIVYTNRVPQTDYFEVKNVYAPVLINVEKYTVTAGRQIITIPFENRYDFTNLSAIKTVCGLYHNNELLEEQNLDLNIPPHSIRDQSITILLPEKLSDDYYFLKLNFYDKDGLHIKEEVVRLMPVNSKLNWITTVTDEKKMLDKSDLENELIIKRGDSKFTFNKSTGSINFIDPQKNLNLIKEGLFLRVGRKPAIASQSYLGRRPEYANYFWLPFILKNPEVLSKDISGGNDSLKITEKLRFKRGDLDGQFVEGIIAYTLDAQGWIHVEYNFTPVNGTGVFLEAGVSFIIPKELSQMRWIGDGPYPSYPDKDKLDEFGIFQMANEDLYFQGNRKNIDAALFTNKVGSGLLVSSGGNSIAVENVPEGILVSHNALVASRFNKYVKPLTEINAAITKEIKGKFSLRPIDENDWTGLLKNVFGNPLKNVEPFKPFYHSYDQ